MSQAPARRILPTTQPQVSIEDLMAIIKQQQAQIEALAKAKPARAVSFKVSEKGCVTMLGTGQYGTTLYASQWATILDHAPALAQFIRDNLDRLSFKDDAQRAATTKAIATQLD